MSEPPSIKAALQVVGGLVDAGVTRFVYAPGSRNAPFAYVLAEYEEAGLIEVFPFVEERGAAFFAVGLMTAEPKPVAVVTTSGTAVAELKPAVLEANHRGLPLIAVTADRPFEVQRAGASQTTFQPGMYGQYVVGEVSIPALEKVSVPTVLRGLRSQVVRLVHTAMGYGGERGPVHLNVAFREPLVPAAGRRFEPAVEVAPVFLEESRRPIPFAKAVKPGLRTVIVAGDGAADEKTTVKMVNAAGALGIPLIAEPTSGLTSLESWIPHGPWVVEALGERVEQVIQVGRPTLTRPVSRLLSNPKVRKVVVSAQANWPDPSGTAAVVTQSLDAPEDGLQAFVSWAQTFRQEATRIGTVLSEVDGLNHVSAARAIWKNSSGVDLWLGASNPIRAFDIAASKPGWKHVYSNRGLAGIDGTIASALGLQNARKQPLRAVLGDLTFAYDLPSLPVRPAEGQDIQLVVFDDGGASIFASLEHGRSAGPQMYERFFAVAQSMDVAQVGAACGWEARQITTLEDLKEAVRKPPVGRSLLHVILPRPASLLSTLRERALSA